MKADVPIIDAKLSELADPKLASNQRLVMTASSPVSCFTLEHSHRSNRGE